MFLACRRVTGPTSIVFGALFLAPGQSGGTETYLRGLVPALAAEHPELRLTVVTTRSGARALRADGFDDLCELVSLRSEEGQRLRRLGGEQIALPRLARRRPGAVLHSLGNSGPIWPRMPHVLTVLDVHFFTTKALGAISSFGYRQVVSRAAHRADVIATISAAARDEIVRVLGIPAERCVVTPLAARAVAVAPTGGIRERFALGDGRAVLCVAAKRPHKNQELLVAALERLPPDVVLVLAGHPEAYDRRLRELARERAVEDQVRFVDYVPDPDLEALWGTAACAAFPTLAEGFGLPVLEAMQRGVPVACSDIPVLREVGGDVPHYFDPHDPVAAAAAILAATADREGAARLGPPRARRFTWAETARATYAAYERAIRCT
jgi:glycosyltransferase involved in cell wall biosynthesis